MKNIFFYDTSIGKVGIADNGEAITDLMYVGGDMPNGAEAGTATDLKGWVAELYDAELKETPLLRKAASELNEFLAGKRKAFDLPLEPQGTPFQKAVWEALTGISYGETRTYRDIAEAVGNPKACRAVGMANNRNPIAILIPCHRVIGAGGKLVGYAGGLDIKKRLLELEKSAHPKV
ncbi:MAG TPA: methylated-DNA--[protein]-cysteine S-methyltransferase [Clostridia bacterium]|nr:methylated-DNA--[protein]-cysteine S-methyltransferase [Clostridia bacterium]